MIWILWHRRLGDLNQMLELAKALAMPYEIKKLDFQHPHYGPISQLNLRNRNILKAPFPQLVICAEAMCSNIAHELKRASAGEVKTVCLARPCGDAGKFDLVLTTSQYNLNGKNIVLLDLPLTDSSMPLSGPKSGVVALIGGSAPPDVLDETTAQIMATEFLAAHPNLTIITSPRTPASVAAVFKQKISKTHVWSREGVNPYAENIAAASEIIVTSDSVSMLADALAQQVSVQVYKLPQRLSVLQKLVAKLFQLWPKCFLFSLGFIEVTPNRLALVERLHQRGFVTWFGAQSESSQKFDAKADLQIAVRAVKLLLKHHEFG
jgi:uncharacterized protein